MDTARIEAFKKLLQPVAQKKAAEFKTHLTALIEANSGEPEGQRVDLGSDPETLKRAMAIVGMQVIANITAIHAVTEQDGNLKVEGADFSGCVNAGAAKAKAVMLEDEYPLTKAIDGLDYLITGFKLNPIAEAKIESAAVSYIRKIARPIEAGMAKRPAPTPAPTAAKPEPVSHVASVAHQTGNPLAQMNYSATNIQTCHTNIITALPIASRALETVSGMTSWVVKSDEAIQEYRKAIESAIILARPLQDRSAKLLDFVKGSYQDQVTNLCAFIADLRDDDHRLQVYNAIRHVLGDSLQKDFSYANIRTSADALIEAIEGKYKHGEGDKFDAFVSLVKASAEIPDNNPFKEYKRGLANAVKELAKQSPEDQAEELARIYAPMGPEKAALLKSHLGSSLKSRDPDAMHMERTARLAGLLTEEAVALEAQAAQIKKSALHSKDRIMALYSSPYSVISPPLPLPDSAPWQSLEKLRRERMVVKF